MLLKGNDVDVDVGGCHMTSSVTVVVSPAFKSLP